MGDQSPEANHFTTLEIASCSTTVQPNKFNSLIKGKKFSYVVQQSTGIQSDKKHGVNF